MIFLTKTLSEIIVRFLGLDILAKIYGYQLLAEKLRIVSGPSNVDHLGAAFAIIRTIELDR